jgi:hypothetical protein
MRDFCFLQPERRILRRLGFDSSNGEVARIYPNLSSIEKFIFRLRDYTQDIFPVRLGAVRIGECEVVILRRESGTFLVIEVGRFLFCVQQSLDHVFDQNLRASP